MEQKNKLRKKDQIKTYFYQEKWILLIVSVSGILYNVGMTAGPWFEGQLAQYLCDIIGGKRKTIDMAILSSCYVLVILFVQFMRYLKRLYVRKFANNISRSMKEVLYGNLVRKSKKELEKSGVGTWMTKAIADVDACVEGMRKFTTEVFDTGVVMVAYTVMLMIYDWRLALISLAFPPIAYFIAQKMKVVVTKATAQGKESAGRLNSASYDRVANAVTYRVYGQEENQNDLYEAHLKDYEKKMIRANIWETTLQPLYQIIAMISVIFILWFGGKNVVGTGWTSWNVAAFSTFLSCFLKLAVKSSKAAKLFNAVQKAKVSWIRIKPFLQEDIKLEKKSIADPADLIVSHLSFGYEEGTTILNDISFEARPGEIIGITGEVACGKSSLGKLFLCEDPYRGHILYGGKELSELVTEEGYLVTGYQGHQSELFSASIKENITFGENEEVEEVLKMVCMDQDLMEFRNGVNTKIGNGGVRLSGGQQARIALARVLYSKMPLLVLDDPFSAVDQRTEEEILKNIRRNRPETVILLISHRLHIFQDLDKVLWLGENGGMFLTPEEMLLSNSKYRQMYEMQSEKGGVQHEK